MRVVRGERVYYASIVEDNYWAAMMRHSQQGGGATIATAPV